MCITNTLFPHKAIHQATWYPPDVNAKPSLKDYVLLKHRLRPSVMDTRVFRARRGPNSNHCLVIVTLYVPQTGEEVQPEQGETL